MGAMSELEGCNSFGKPSAAASVSKLVVIWAPNISPMTSPRSSSSITCSTTLSTSDRMPLFHLCSDFLRMSYSYSLNIVANSVVTHPLTSELASLAITSSWFVRRFRYNRSLVRLAPLRWPRLQPHWTMVRSRRLSPLLSSTLVRFHVRHPLPAQAIGIGRHIKQIGDLLSVKACLGASVSRVLCSFTPWHL